MFDSWYVLALCLVASVALASVGAVAEEGAGVRSWEGSLSLPTYAWYDDVNPVFAPYEGRIYYPYTRQEHIAKTSAPRTYRALFLENEYLRVVCLPELGGRIHSVLDKSTGEEMFHRNDVIKPALIAMRGAWIGGGIEWNPGPHGHTVTIVSPVDALILEHDDGSATLVVGNTEKMFGTRWTVRLTLHPGKAYLDEEIRIFNPTDGTHPYYFWNCTAFPNRPGTRFIYPMTLGTNHSGTEFYSWPVHGGKDLSWLKNYDTMSSIFAFECSFDFFGAYDVHRDRGIVSYANHHVLKGKKAWTWGQDDFGVVSQMSLSDAGREGAPYIEVQSGPLLTQADYGMLKPHQQIAWREAWYPVHGLGDGFEYATGDAAVQVYRQDGEVELRILATGEFPGAECTLSQGETVLLEERVDLSPCKPTCVRLASPPEGPLAVMIRSREGTALLDYATPLEIPKVEAPDKKALAASLEGDAVEAKYLKAYLRDSQSDAEHARAAYETALAGDPRHVPSLCALATLDIESGRFVEAEQRARAALERNPGSGEAWYLLGVARLHQDDFEDVLACGYKAVHTGETVALGYGLVGRARMAMGDYAGAVEAFDQARRTAPEDAQHRDLWFAARHAAGDQERLARDILPIITELDPTDFLARAVYALEGPEPMRVFVDAVAQIAGEKEFVLLEAATFLASVRLYGEACGLLNACIEKESACFTAGPMPYYYLAYYLHRLGEREEAERWLDRAAARPSEYAFPSRVAAIDALRFAVSVRPNDAHAQLLLGHVYAGVRRMEDALPHWQRAAELEPTLSVAWRLLGLNAWKKANDLEAANAAYRKALEARPRDPILYRDLAHILEAEGKRPEAIALIEQMPRDPNMRYASELWLAQAYLDEQRYDECLALLEHARFSNWEGQSTPHDIFVSVLLGRGKARFEAGKHGDALGDFERALTYPENLEVGARYRATDAEGHYWLGKALLALNRPAEARAAWGHGAGQITSADPPLPFISVSAAQDEYVKRCATALEVLTLSE